MAASRLLLVLYLLPIVLEALGTTGKGADVDLRRKVAVVAEARMRFQPLQTRNRDVQKEVGGKRTGDGYLASERASVFDGKVRHIRATSDSTATCQKCMPDDAERTSELVSEPKDLSGDAQHETFATDLFKPNSDAGKGIPLETGESVDQQNTTNDSVEMEEKAVQEPPRTSVQHQKNLATGQVYATEEKKGDRKVRQISPLQAIVGIPVHWRNVLLPRLRILVGTSQSAGRVNVTRNKTPGKSQLLDSGHYDATSRRYVTCYTGNRRPFEGFACDDENCIPKGWVCDGEQDCDSGADEAHCRTGHCPSGQFQCLTRGNGACLTTNHLCDGYIDCQDGSDEDGHNCHSHGSSSYCRSGYFQCRDGQGCVHPNRVCDWDEDCDDGSDERYCRGPLHHYDSCHFEFEFECYRSSTRDRSPKCIARGWLCDGHEDCPDGEDEMSENCRDSDFLQRSRAFSFLLFPSTSARIPSTYARSTPAMTK